MLDQGAARGRSSSTPNGLRSTHAATPQSNTAPRERLEGAFVGARRPMSGLRPTAQPGGMARSAQRQWQRDYTMREARRHPVSRSLLRNTQAYKLKRKQALRVCSSVAAQRTRVLCAVAATALNTTNTLRK